MNTNFAEHPIPSDPARDMKRRIFFVAVIVGVVVFLSTVLFGIGRFASAAFSVREHLQETVHSLETLSFESAKVSMDEALADAYHARSGLRWIGWTRSLPWVGDHISALEILMDSGITSAEAFADMLEVVIEVEGVLLEAQDALADIETQRPLTLEAFPDTFKKDLLLTLHQQSPVFYETAMKLRLAEQNLARLDDMQLSQAFERSIAPIRELLPDLVDTFEVLAPITQSIDAFAGLNQDRQWLVLFLNNTELRPGGGFLGVFGLVQIGEGSIDQLSVADSYAIDQFVEDDGYFVTAPEPVSYYLGVDKWYFRDANWSPDFVQSSKDAVTLLRQEYGYIDQPVPQIDGVIGITPTVAERLMAIVGPVTVDGITFTSENFTETLEYDVEYGFAARGISWENRKDIIGTLTNTIIEAVYNLPIDEWPALFGLIQTSFEDKQLAFYGADEGTQEVFIDAGWAAHVDSGNADDVLMVVDSNMGALKTNHAVESDITYSIEPSDGGYIGQVSIVYDHQGQFDFRTTRYQTYTRIFVPEGSEMISLDGSPIMEEADVVDELGLRSFGAYTIIDPGEQGTLTFRYRLPEQVSDAIESGVYQLAVFKQVGAKNHALTLDLDFGKTVRSATPSEQEGQFGDLKYQLNTQIDQDSVVTVEF